VADHVPRSAPGETVRKSCPVALEENSTRSARGAVPEAFRRVSPAALLEAGG